MEVAEEEAAAGVEEEAEAEAVEEPDAGRTTPLLYMNLGLC
jgi:hypothetical protein